MYNLLGFSREKLPFVLKDTKKNSRLYQISGFVLHLGMFNILTSEYFRGWSAMSNASTKGIATYTGQFRARIDNVFGIKP